MGRSVEILKRVNDLREDRTKKIAAAERLISGEKLSEVSRSLGFSTRSQTLSYELSSLVYEAGLEELVERNFPLRKQLIVARILGWPVGLPTISGEALVSMLEKSAERFRSDTDWWSKKKAAA